MQFETKPTVEPNPLASGRDSPRNDSIEMYETTPPEMQKSQSQNNSRFDATQAAIIAACAALAVGIGCGIGIGYSIRPGCGHNMCPCPAPPPTPVSFQGYNQSVISELSGGSPYAFKLPTIQNPENINCTGSGLYPDAGEAGIGLCTSASTYAPFQNTPMAADLTELFPPVYCGEQAHTMSVGPNRRQFPYHSMSTSSLDVGTNAKIGVLIAHGTDWVDTNNYICTGAMTLLGGMLKRLGWSEDEIWQLKPVHKQVYMHTAPCRDFYNNNTLTNDPQSLYAKYYGSIKGVPTHLCKVKRESSSGSVIGTNIWNYTAKGPLLDQLYIATPTFITPSPDKPLHGQPWIPPAPPLAASTLSQCEDAHGGAGTCPKVRLVTDYISMNYLFWDYCQGNSTCQFSMGASSTALYQDRYTAFSIVDKMIQKFLDVTKFPQMQKVVMVGHGGGGDLFIRHALFSEYAQGVKDKLRYITGNAIVFTYFDDNRPLDANCGYTLINENKATCEFGPVTQDTVDKALAQTKQMALQTSGDGQASRLSTCPEFNWIPQADGYENAGWANTTFVYPNQLAFGFGGASDWAGSYLQYVNINKLVENFGQLDVTMVQGLNDTAPWESYENPEACSMMTQGCNHLVKGVNYHQYLYQYYTSRNIPYKTKLLLANNVGHEYFQMFSSQAVQEVFQADPIGPLLSKTGGRRKSNKVDTGASSL